jgi:hypothetical protein
MKKKHTLLLVIISLSVSKCTFLQPNALAKPPTVDLCELVRNPTSFHNKIVRTNALLFSNAENTAFYDSACPAKSIWVEYDSSYVAEDDPMKRKFEREPCLTRPLCNVRVTAVGLFQGPSEGPYGHLDGYEFQFKIMRIESVEPVIVSKETPNN